MCFNICVNRQLFSRTINQNNPANKPITAMQTRLLFFIVLFCCTVNAFSQDADLYRTIVKLDSTFFHAYNNCDLEKQAQFYADTIEFFHDKSGLDTSKQRILASTKKYVCGKVTRELVPGSIEVSPLPGYGAVEIGMHSFHNNQEKNSKPKPSRFIIIWKQDQRGWQITKVISLH
jgi:ketosteroid isomerase-like protein